MKGLLVGLFCLAWNLLPHTWQGWIAVAVSLPFILHVQILIHELGHYVFRKIFVVPTKRMVIGTGPLMFRIKSFEVRWIPTSGSVGPGVYCMDIPVRHKLWVYRGGILANGVSMLLWLKNPVWVLCGLMMIWANTRVVVFREKRTMTDGAWIALLRGGFRLPEGFEPCTEDSGFEGTQEG
ncbi:hypothetical protein TC41_2460 [Alicyclobacillus acidocaldarius subsp. acidocaldarius Tc-4-1]|uniref:Peptidase M50 domain-containing protein n=2 Tax=Alicyclobacillus acidocaldarius TaxID=405212 RepID=F8IH05_ALIAT|nr:hypothetical protein TC41_2460 [Alicyclobacillus acidocaldarius subsp. acidocaldarius Tc-4-1]